MMRKIYKWAGIALLCPVALFLLLTILLYIPPLQNYIVEKVTELASKETNMQIRIDRIRLGFPLKLVVNGVEVVSKQDTLLLVDRLKVDVQLLPLLRQKVEVDGIDLKNAQVNTSDLVATMKLKGSLGSFHLSAHGVDLESEKAKITDASLTDANLHICLKDTIIDEDTTSTPLYWELLLQKIALKNVVVSLQLSDTSSFSAAVDEAELRQGVVDLRNNAYSVRRFGLKNGAFAYHADTLAAQQGWDASHIVVSNLQMRLDSLQYAGKQMSLSIAQLSGRERSGLDVLSLSGRLKSNAKKLGVSGLSLRTSDSSIDFSGGLDWNALEPNKGGSLNARFLAELGKQDVMTILGKMPGLFVTEYPNSPIVVRAGIDGNIDKLHITGLQAKLEGAFRASAEGELVHLLDSTRRAGNITLTSEAQNLDFVAALVDTLHAGTFAIPHNITLKGEIGVDGPYNKADLWLQQGSGLVSLLASYHSGNQAYEADLKVDSLHILDYLPKDSLTYLSAQAVVKGVGTDIYSPRTHITAQASIDTLQYGRWNLSNITLDAGLQKNQLNVLLDSKTPILTLNAALNGILSRKEVAGQLKLNVQDVDIYELGFVQSPLRASLAFDLDVKSNWKKLYALKGGVRQVGIITSKQNYHPKDLIFDAYTDVDSTFLSVNAGDFRLDIEGEKELETILKHFTDFSSELMKQFKNKKLDMASLTTFLPEVCAKISSGKDNPINNYLATQGIRYNRFFMDLDASPNAGVSGTSYLYALKVDSLHLDTLRCDIRQDSLGLKLYAKVKNAPTNKQFVFDASLVGMVSNEGAQVELNYMDAKQKTGINLGIGANLDEQGFRCYFFPEHPIIAYKTFNLNEGNYVLFGHDGRIEGKVNLLTDDGVGIRFYSTPNEEASHDLSFNLCKIDIGDLLSVLPYMPDIDGILNSDIHYIKSEGQMSLAAESSVENLSYEQCPIGNLTNSTIYLPKDDATHYVDTRFSREDNEIFALSGDYKEVEEGLLDMTMEFEHFPLSLGNGFIPDQLVSLEGDADGSLTIKGSTRKPLINGELVMDSAFVNSDVYGVRFQLDKKPVVFTNSNANFNNYNIYTRGQNPFTLSGSVNFSNLDRIMLNLRMRASDYELVNAPRNKNSTVYGKVYVDFFSYLRGPLDNLLMRGNMTVLGKTDVTYVLKDSPLTVDDRMSDLVSFVNFSDSTKVEELEDKNYNLGGIDLLMNIQIEQGAEAKVDISADRESYVELRGGGNLTMQYTPQGDLLMSGRYTLTSGEMKYALPIIPLKTFRIKEGSYVEFTGNPTNPTMKISATERVRATVSENDASRTVTFEVGVAISNSLEHMGLAFTLEAPEDMTIQNELAAMSLEERGKLAVAMLATGVYLGGDGGLGGFNANNALNSFLQSEISNIAGSALKTVDISLGMEDATSADGSSHTDYSFRFAKRFWNNRLSVVIGGRISSGNDAATTNNQSFIDDISLEWRLDDSGTRYIRVFHNKNYESILEGEIVETGVGIVLRRKMTKLGELFIFKKKKDKTVNREVTPKP